MRRLGAAAGALALAGLLAACGGGSTTGGGGGSTGAKQLPTAHLVPQATAAQACNGAFKYSLGQVYSFGQTVYAEVAFALAYPSYIVPASAGQAPFKIGDGLGEQVQDSVFGGPANANPDVAQGPGITITVCNNGSAPTKLTGAGMGLMTVTPHASPIDVWQLCETAYQVSTGQPSMGGCGGGLTADELLSASFPASAGQGATAQATLTSSNNVNGYGPLPVTLQPGATILMTMAVTMPTAPGTYTLGATLSGSDIPSAVYAPLAPQVFAAVGHKWNGQNCMASTMQSQIPASDPNAYYICP